MLLFSLRLSWVLYFKQTHTYHWAAAIVSWYWTGNPIIISSAFHTLAQAYFILYIVRWWWVSFLIFFTCFWHFYLRLIGIYVLFFSTIYIEALEFRISNGFIYSKFYHLNTLTKSKQKNSNSYLKNQLFRFYIVMPIVFKNVFIPVHLFITSSKFTFFYGSSLNYFLSRWIVILFSPFYDALTELEPEHKFGGGLSLDRSLSE